MIRALVKQKRKIAMLLLTLFVSEMLLPATAYAVTGGPSQPEFESFEPVEVTDVVDVSTGDFTYNIPLLTVPGPNGGYPINLNYHAGITMEQEASWVGLGWNLNVGEINRDMRGIPDDFDGDEIKKEIYMKNNTTIGMKYSPPVNFTGGFELFGQELNYGLGSNYNVYYNNYNGLGFAYGYGVNSVVSYSAKPVLIPSINLSFDSQSGVGLEAGIGLMDVNENGEVSYYRLNTSVNTRKGMQSISFEPSVTKSGEYSMIQSKEERFGKNNASNDAAYGIGSPHSPGYNLSFASTYTPSVPLSMKGASININFKKGTEQTSVHYIHRAYNLALIDHGVKNNITNNPSYGYSYLQNLNRNDESQKSSIMDFNREKEFPVTKDAPTLPVPIHTYDIYNIKAQGLTGSFRSYRNDLGIYSDPSNVVNTSIVKIGAEAGAGTTAELGFNLGGGFSISYSGIWLDKFESIENYKFSGSSRFEMSGEQTAGNSEEERYSGQTPTAFAIKNSYSIEDANEVDIIGFKTKVENRRANSTSPLLGENIRTTKNKTVNNIEHFIINDLVRNENYNDRPGFIYTEGEFPGFTLERPAQYNYNAHPGSHVAAIKVINPNGMVYEFGLPTYNMKQKEVIFSIDQANINTRTIGYSSTGDIKEENRNGNEHLYSSTEIPEYSKNHLLTGIYAADYVDVSGNGPTDDDLGYFAKFNYTKISDNYKWRTPFTNANYLRGYYSNALDDKAAYIYGEKELWYLNSIETKTHVAVFELGERHDGFGAFEEHNGTGTGSIIGESSRYLKEIRLYSKNDLSTPVKTVKFEYDYSLCDGVPNSNNGEGKLTLKKVWFEYRGNSKGFLSPYEFSYSSNNNVVFNPDYNAQQADRWGFYKPDKYDNSNYKFTNEDYPYVEQNKVKADMNMSAWSLTKIKLPSGGMINIQYESDDYSHVQNKKATQMLEVINTGDLRFEDPIIRNGQLFDKKADFIRLYFKLNSPVSTIDQVAKYVGDIGSKENPMYFKVFMDLKKHPDSSPQNIARDYVDGYCQVVNYGLDDNCNTDNVGAYELGYVDVKQVPIHQTDGDKGQIHPFSKSAWEYLKMERPDLLYPSTPITNIGSSWQQIINIFTSLGNDIKNILGYYRHAYRSGWGSTILVDQDDVDWHPSFIRLYNPNQKKLGGGIRVKKITASDEWNSISDGGEAHTYGTEYTYELPDGTSSGVASYEPLIGGEENPFRLPSDRYSDRRFTHRHKELYVEEPFCEEYFPAPVVVYRRVVVNPLRRLNQNDEEINKNSASGKIVYEFYTAKEFPVQVEYTKVEHKGYALPLFIPFIGTQSYNNHGYSQGYSVFLNDMHGKLKSVSTYAYNDNINNELTQPISKTEYIFKTEQPFNPEGGNRLNNNVTVLRSDGIYGTDVMGSRTEFALDLIEHSSGTFTAEVGINANMPQPFTFIPSAWPIMDYSESIFRSIVNVKVVHQTGILEEQRSHGEGSSSVMKNLMFDAQTGTALLTSVKNNFDKEIFSYSFPAHWNYDGMGAASLNYRIATSVSANLGNGKFDVLPDPVEKSIFVLGDKIEVLETGNVLKYIWVSEVNDDDIKLINEDGTDYNPNVLPSYFKVIESGRKNHLVTTTGSIVSLSNPLENRKFPLLVELNNYLDQYVTDFTNPLTFTDCATNEIITMDISLDGGNSILLQPQTSPNGQKCDFKIHLPPPLITNTSNISNYDLIKAGKSIAWKHETNLSIDYYSSFEDLDGCYNECLDDVLFASATGFHDTWEYAYEDAGAPDIGGAAFALKAAANPWRYGKAGVWRQKDVYAFLVDRKKARDVYGQPTNIAKDGVYDNFVLFNWKYNKDLKAINDEWTFASTVTRYNPYGFAIESRDALNIYSSALYGYDNSLMTANTTNAAYFETGFDGFEENTSAVYEAFGHLPFTFSTGSGTINSVNSHTGKKSLFLNAQSALLNTTSVDYATFSDYENDATLTDLAPNVKRKKYVITAWYKPENGNDVPKMVVTGGGVDLPSVQTQVSKFKIEGWYRVETVFELTALTGAIQINLHFEDQNSLTTSGWIDDIRFQPFKSGMTTYVYDPATLWVVAELDNRNFATLYNYDDEGSLVQVKKETERGVMTIKQGRSNVKLNQ